ncbi:hypothetical protein AB1207_16795 [Kineococcus endophyticus]|uniref:AAA domain-containing protein n=1 Tax=Kineococcus endophyticus TaxID=1181883 RepID=A0ABV3P9T3_9ACTN
MLLLVTGASGQGKSTVRRAVAPRLADEGVECVEFSDLVAIPAAPDTAWRQRSAEEVVRHALTLERSGRHLLFAGDPLAPGEVVGAPSGPALGAFDVLLLDADEATQRTRLTGRGPVDGELVHHVAFATWFRGHVRDAGHRSEVLTAEGWDGLAAERLVGQPWRAAVLDTTDLAPDAVADAVEAWALRCLRRGRG